MQAKALDSVASISKTKATTQPPLIAHILYRLAVGGLENGVVNLINQIPETQYRHVIISLTDATDFKNRITRKDVEIYCLNKKPGQDISYLYRLWKLLKKIKPNIVHTRNLAALETAIVTSLMGIKYRIHSEHGWGVKDDNVKANFKYLLFRRVMSKLVHRNIGLSKNIEGMLIEDIKVPMYKVRQVYNGVDSEKFSKNNLSNKVKNELFPSNFLSKDSILIGTVGRMDPIKDQRSLLHAFIELSEGHYLSDNLRLVFIGDGEMMSELREIAAKSNFEKHVWFAGSKNDIQNYMQHMDIFCLPSKNEGISNTILEAMSSELPVVATDVGGNGELIVKGVTGDLVPAECYKSLAKSLTTYVENSDLRRSHGANGRQRILNHFSLDKMVQNYVSIYDGF